MGSTWARLATLLVALALPGAAAAQGDENSLGATDPGGTAGDSGSRPSAPAVPGGHPVGAASGEAKRGMTPLNLGAPTLTPSGASAGSAGAGPADAGSAVLGESAPPEPPSKGVSQGASDLDTTPNTVTDIYQAMCQYGYHHNFEALPPDKALFDCLDAAKYCPSWNVYEPDKYLACLRKYGYWSDGDGPVTGKDKVLANCIYQPRGLQGQTFRDKPRTRNARWVKLDYSSSGSGLYGDTPDKRVMICLAQYRYLQGRFDHECADSCASPDWVRSQWTKTKNDFVTVDKCSHGIPACGGVGFCLGEHYDCVPSPGGDCSPPYPLCLENGTGKFSCVQGRYVCDQVP